MEVGEGSSIARDMGRSWTTHTGGGGASGAGGKQRKKKNGKKNTKPTWASVEVRQYIKRHTPPRTHAHTNARMLMCAVCALASSRSTACAIGTPRVH
eukprot:COSAG02_NODE_7923_length_2784_cov_6.985847_4_plen_97_part_00